MKTRAIDLGADLVGVASIDRFERAYEGHRPGDILKDATSVVVCAKQIPSGALQGPSTSHQSVMDAVHRLLDEIAFKLSLYIETHCGGLAVPVPADEPYRHWESGRLHGRGDLSHKHAAVAAGLGRLGKNTILITPSLGNRVQLVSIVTTQVLDPDPLLEGDPCVEDCRLCMDSCPTFAIKDGGVDQSLCRPHTMRKLAKGHVVEDCRVCRRVCPEGGAGRSL
jgi:epoxyqueuosine reductase QueG